MSEGRCGTEFAVGDVGESEPVVPVAAGLLERLEGAGETMGCGRVGRFGNVACKFGDFSDVVESAVVSLRGRWDVVGVPAESELAEMGGGNGERFGGAQRVEQCFKGSCEFGLVFMKGAEKAFCCFAALLLKEAAKFAGLL